MAAASREFQIFAKPTGSLCNLRCRYCYYLGKKDLYSETTSPHMPDDILETYIVQHIAAFPGSEINFSWHGGEPTILGVDYFQKIVAFQRRHRPRNRRITNGMQTNGTLLDDNWCRFLKRAGFSVGISIDGPPEIHNRYRVSQSGLSTHEKAFRGYALLQKYDIPHDILCVVNRHNVKQPLEVYRFFKKIGARYIGFLPLVEPPVSGRQNAGPLSVTAEAFGDFLCAIFDEWMDQDIGRIRVQIFEEATRSAFGQAHSLCVFRETCGDVPVVEHNGDFYSCDHFVRPEYRLGNIQDTSLAELIDCPEQIAFGRVKRDSLPRYCRQCDVLDMCNGECPKNRFISTPQGEAGLNFLCAGYKRFFTHCRPFVAQLAALWQAQTEHADRRPQPQATVVKTNPKIGRNDPCPCGSGKKYKKCCLVK